MVKFVTTLHTDDGRQRKRGRITGESQKGLALGVQTRCTVEDKPLCANSSKADNCFYLRLQPHMVGSFHHRNPTCSPSESTHLDPSKLDRLQPTHLTHSGQRMFWHTTRASLHGSECVRGQRPSVSDLRVTFLGMTCDKTGRYGSKWLDPICDRASPPGPYHMF